MLSTFNEFEFSANKISHRVLKKGNGSQPAVLIIQELPGITKETLALADRLHQDGFTIYLPILLGEPNSNFEPLKNLMRLCISKEFHFLHQRRSSPITNYLRALCQYIQAECDGKPIGAIGMCFSGGFVLSLMIDESVAAPVMSQPAPLNTLTNSFSSKPTFNISDEEFAAAKQRSEREGIPVLGLRFTNDILCPQSRFNYLSDQFGDRFQRIEIDSSLFNKHKIKPWAHSVLTTDYVDRKEHPTREAYEEVVKFLKERLC